MITRIYVDNYRCFSNFTFEPKRMNLLVGDNGSGKSSLIDAITELCALVARPDALRGVLLPRSRTRWDTRLTQRFEIQYRSDGEVFDWAVSLESQSPLALMNSISRETVKKDGVLVAELDGGPNPTLRVRGKEIPIPYELGGSLLSLRLSDADLQRLHRTVEATNVFKLDVLNMEDVSEKPTELVRRDGKNFPSNYRAVRERDFVGTTQLHVALKTVIPGFSSLELIKLGEDAARLMVQMSPGPGRPVYPVGFAELSEGQRALVFLYYLVTMFGLHDRTVFIDEPDNYVSLRELQPWLQTLSQVVEEENAQAFIISHNPEVIDYLAADSAWLFERDEGGPVRLPRPLPIDRNSGLKASEQLARGWIDGS